MKCLKCGAYVYSADKFCRNCGTTLTKDNCQYGDNISNSVYDGSSCHEKQYDYSYNYSNKSDPKYDLNASHEDQYNYNYQYSYDPNKYAYAATYQPSGEDKYIKAYVGPNYETLKKQKFSLPALLFGVYYLLYRKLWGYAFVYILINLAAQMLLGESLSQVVSLIMNIYLAKKFCEIYMKKAENHVERIKQENLDKTTQELLNICKKKGGASIAIPIAIVTLLSIIGLILIGILTTMEITENNISNNHQTQDVSQNENYTMTYYVPNGFILTESNNTHKSYTYFAETSSCHITIEEIENSTLYKTEEDYIKRKLIPTTDETLSPITVIALNENTWKYAQLESYRQSETIYAKKLNNKLYIINTRNYKYNNMPNEECNTKYNQILNTIKFTN